MTKEEIENFLKDMDITNIMIQTLDKIKDDKFPVCQEAITIEDIKVLK